MSHGATTPFFEREAWLTTVKCLNTGFFVQKIFKAFEKLGIGYICGGRVYEEIQARGAKRHCQLHWERIRDDLSTLQATEFQTPNFQFFQRNEPSPNLLSTLKSLEIPMPKVVLSIYPTTTET